MKNLIFVLFLVAVTACNKDVESIDPCDRTVICHRTYYTYNTCTNGQYDNVYEHTIIDTIPFCQTQSYCLVAKAAEDNVRHLSPEFDQFVRQYPTDCGCDD